MEPKQQWRWGQERKTEQYVVRVTATMADFIETQATALGVNAPEAIRQLIERSLALGATNDQS